MSPRKGGRPLRRAEREISDPAQIAAIFAEAKVLFLAFRDEPAPYVVPVCFGHERGTLYVHGAPAGTKIDLLRAHPEVGFSASTEPVVTPGVSACDWSCRARSVVGTATARIVEDDAERVRGLDAIMRHYAGTGYAGTGSVAVGAVPVGAPAYKAGPPSRTCVIALRMDTVRAKRLG